MIAEHIFVTTLKPAEAFDLSTQFLGHFGFVPGAITTDSDPKQQNLSFSRGAARPRKTDPLNKWRPRVMIQYDRGRITVAASIMSPVSGRWTTESEAIPKTYRDLAEKFLFQITTSLDNLLAHNGSPDKALADLTEFEQKIGGEYSQRSKRRTITMVIVVGVFILAMIIMVVALVANVR